MLDRLGFFISHSFNDLRVNKQRTLFALLCIAAGVAAIVSMQTLAHIITDTLDQSVQETNRGDLRLQPERQWSPYIVDSPAQGGLTVTDQGIEYLQTWLDTAYPGSEITYQKTLSESDDIPAGFIVSIPERGTYKLPVFHFMVDADAYPLYGRVETEGGTGLSELLQAPTDVVLSQNLADDLEAELGDQVRVSGANSDFTVRGIVPSDSESGLNEQAFIGHLFGYYYLDWSAVEVFDDVEALTTNIYIKLGDPSQVDDAAEDLDDLRRNAFSITTTTDIKDANQQVAKFVDDMVVVMSLVSLLIGGIGIVNTMMVIVGRRTNEVAVLKTLGLEPQGVVQLFLVEAILFGILGSILGIVAGWGLTYAVKGVGENFLGQRLSFSIAPTPALNGLVVGVAITTIFGFLPTLAAGQIRPAIVLRPSDNVIPSTGRLSAFVALIGLIMALSVVTQGLIGDLLDFELQGVSIRTYTAMLGGVYGALIVVPVVLGGILDMRRRRRGRSWPLRFLLWLVLAGVIPAASAAFGYAVPALLILTGTFIITGYLYITLWLLIWAMGGGRIRDLWPGILVLLFPLFLPLVVILPVLILPTWIIGRLIQRFSFVDMKIAMRSMLSTKSRGASTLLALVVGVFTLSVITMLVDSITSALEELVEQGAGGNLLIANTSGPDATDELSLVLDERMATGEVDGYAIVNTYDARVTEYYDASTGRTVTRSFPRYFDAVEGRTITSNLPDLNMIEGRNLDPALDSGPDADGYWPAVVLRSEEDVNVIESRRAGAGDRITLVINGDRAHPVKLAIVGVAEQGLWFGEAEIFTLRAAFGDRTSDETIIIAEVGETNIKPVRRELLDVPGTIIIETRIFNDLVNSIVDQFTSLPILVAALALVTGGIVIANSVALSTMERRREIGIMKAVGLQRERVLGMLLLENGLMGIVGGLIGVGISFIAIVLMLREILDDQFGKAVPYTTAFTLMALCILISLGAALLSVWSASGEKPLNVLRHE